MSEIATKEVSTKLHEQVGNFEQLLESTVVANWADLMRGRSGLVHIEYEFAPSATLDHLRVWSSIRPGYWLLACTYWMAASQSHESGIRFDNGVKSEGLASILEVVMRNQNLFSLPKNLGWSGLLQIEMPTEEESKEAAESLKNALSRVNSFAAPAPTAVS